MTYTRIPAVIWWAGAWAEDWLSAECRLPVGDEGYGEPTRIERRWADSCMTPPTRHSLFRRGAHWGMSPLDWQQGGDVGLRDYDEDDEIAAQGDDLTDGEPEVDLRGCVDPREVLRQKPYFSFMAVRLLDGSRWCGDAIGWLGELWRVVPLQWQQWARGGGIFLTSGMMWTYNRLR